MKLVVNRLPDSQPEVEQSEDPVAEFASETAPAAVRDTSRDTANRFRLPAVNARVVRRAAIAALSVLVVVAAGVLGIEQLRARWTAAATGRVTIVASQAGAVVTIDGVARGVTPLTIDLPQGGHKLSLRRAGMSKDLTIDVRRGVELVQNIDLALPPATTGALFVSSDPPGLRIVVDGASHGSTPGSVERLAPGTHIVSLVGKAGSIERSVVIREGVVTTLHVAAAAAPSATPAPAVGSVTITSPIDVQLFEGQTLVGSSRSARLFLAAGSHTITAVNNELGFRREIPLEVKSGVAGKLAIPVPNGALSVNARPWAEVLIDGKSIGETPIGNYALPIGSHELVLRHPQLGERRQTVVIAVGRTARVGLDLRQ